MNVVSKALAKKILSYFEMRAPLENEVRLLLTHYPASILRDTCEMIIELSDGINANGDLTFANGVTLSLAYIQYPGTPEGELLTHDGVVYGAGPDFPVSLRNRGNSVLLAVPPELLEVVHESIKTNTFQSFHLNVEFGSPREIMRSICREVFGDSHQADLLGEILVTVREREMDRAGEIGDVNVFGRIDRFIESLSVGEAIDWRLLGLLPQRSLILDTHRTAAEVSSDVRRNLQFQTDLAEGLARNQVRHILTKFPESAASRRLLEHLATYSFEISLDEDQWRRDWPSELSIDIIQRGDQTSKKPIELRKLEVIGDSKALGIQIASERVEVRWKVHSEAPDVSLTIELDNNSQGLVDLLSHSHELVGPFERGFHTVQLSSTELSLVGQTAVRFFSTGGNPSLLLTVNDGLPGSSTYAVPPEETFRLNWAVVGDSNVHDQGELYLESARANDGPLALDLSGGGYDMVGGVSDPTDLSVLIKTEGGALKELVTVAPVAVPTSATPIMSIAHALTSLADQLSPSNAGKKSIEMDAEGQEFEIRASGPEGEVHRLMCQADAGPLDDFERSFLSDPASPWPRAVVYTEESDETAITTKVIAKELTEQADQALTSSDWTDFLESRAILFGLISERGGFSRTPLSELKGEVSVYLENYLSILTLLSPNNVDLSETGILLGLVDCVHLSSRNEGAEWAGSGSKGASALLMSPTHPLRLAWLTQQELRIRRYFEDGRVWVPSSIAGVSSKDVPPVLLGPEYQHFHAAATAASGRWGIYFREGVIELDQAVAPSLSKRMPFDVSADTFAVSAGQIRSAIGHYQELHPHRTNLSIGYINPGSGESLRSAVVGLAKRPATQTDARAFREPSFSLTLVNMGYDPASGQAFQADDSESTERVSLQKVDTDGEVSGLDKWVQPPIHIMFASDLFQTSGRAEAIEGRAHAPAVDGLFVERGKYFEAIDQPQVISHAFVNPPDESTSTGLPLLLHKGQFLFQRLSSCTRESRGVSDLRGRAVLAEIRDQTRKNLDQVHDVSDWVYLMDSHVDVEYFDQPAITNEYVLDYLPRSLSGSPKRPRNYVISTRRYGSVQRAIERFMRSAYGPGNLTTEMGPAVVASLNRLSGHLLMKVLGNPTGAKGAVGMALARSVFERIDQSLLEDSGQQLQCLVPVDDYADQWLMECKTLREGLISGERADLLMVTLGLVEGEASLDLRVIEVKNRAAGYSAAELREGPGKQVVRTLDLVETVFGLGPSGIRADQDFKNVELARLLDFHLRRHVMQRWGTEGSELGVSRGLRSTLFDLVANGAYQMADSGTRGAVFHFNPTQTVSISDVSSAPEGIVGCDGVLYFPFGLEDILNLLRGDQIEGISALMEPLLNVDSDQDRAEATAHRKIVVKHEVDLDREPAGSSSVSGKSQGTEAASVEETEITRRTADAVMDVSSEGPESEVPLKGHEVSEEALGVLSGFEGFVGNEEAIKRMLPALITARRGFPPRMPVNLAFTGPASTGKTELSRRVATILDLPYVGTTGSALTSLDDLLGRMVKAVDERGGSVSEVGREGGLPIRRFPPMVVFVDEAHVIKRPVQEALLTLLEPDDRRATSSTFVADAGEVTFIFATTDWGDLLGTLQTRLQRVQLRTYSLEEVARIIANRFPNWSDHVCTRLAVAGRLIPRVALERAREFSTRVEAFPEREEIDLLNEAYELWQLDPEGLDDVDRSFLAILDDAGDAVGLQRLANQLSLGQAEITRNIEPYLVQTGMIEVTGQGRRLSEKGKRYLRTSGPSSGATTTRT